MQTPSTHVRMKSDLGLQKIIFMDVMAINYSFLRHEKTFYSHIEVREILYFTYLK